MNSLMETLKKKSVRISPGMVAVSSRLNHERTLCMSNMASKLNGRYAIKNLTICFITEGEIYSTPYTRCTETTLIKAGFSRDVFYVPFANGDYPKSEQSKWNALRENAHQSYAEDFATDCNDFCVQNHIGSISEEYLQNCFQIPAQGVWVRKLNFQHCYYPAISSFILNSDTSNLIGKFYTNKGCVVFVYRDGKTYVTKGYKIVDALRAAGYKEACMLVPFSNGEEIIDSDLRSIWESITNN